MTVQIIVKGVKTTSSYWVSVKKSQYNELTSETYSNASNARRAAKKWAAAIPDSVVIDRTKND